MTSALSSLIEELLLQLTTQKASLKLSLPQPFLLFLHVCSSKADDVIHLPWAEICDTALSVQEYRCKSEFAFSGKCINEAR